MSRKEVQILMYMRDFYVPFLKSSYACWVMQEILVKIVTFIFTKVTRISWLEQFGFNLNLVAD